MRRQPSLPIAVAAVTCMLLLDTVPAKATSLATWVSGTGTDAGTCPISKPCRTFKYALTQTSNGGMINVLSAGSYGGVSIAKSISIVAEGVEALIQSTVACPGGGTAAVCISGGTTISLRGLTIDLAGSTGKHGIVVNSGRALHIQNSVVRRAGGFGIAFFPNTPSELFVSNSTIADNHFDGFAIEAPAAGIGSYSATLDRVHLDNNGGTGFIAVALPGNAIKAAVRESVATGNAFHGISVATAGGTATAMIDRTMLVNNQNTGLNVAGTNAVALIGDSTISGNATGLGTATGGQIISYQTNKLNSNTIDGAPTSTIAMK